MAAKNLGRWLSLAAAGLVLACAGLAAAAIETREGDSLVVSGDFTDMMFAAGDDVTLSLNASDDSFAAGDNVTIRGAKLDDVFVAGSDLSFEDFTARDVVAAGGDIDILSGEIADDLVVAGGRIELSRAAHIVGALVIAGGELIIESPIGAGVRAAGSEITINAEITGDVFLDGGEINIGPEARIHGALTHRGRDVKIDPAAIIDGAVTVLPARPERNFHRMEEFFTWMAFSVVVGFLLLGVFTASLLPRLMNDVSAIARTHPFAMLGFGLLLAVFMPILIVLMLFTVFGAPLGLMLGAAFSLMWMLAFVSAAYAFGMFLRGRVRHVDTAPDLAERALWTTIALVALGLAALIPVIGVFIVIAAILLGLGAVALQTVRALSRSSPDVA